jgi:hypothetical protein
MRAVRARIFALFAALIMLLPSGAWARSQYYCRMTGGLVASCCCGVEAHSQSPKHAQELQDADCCRRISPSTPSASLGTRGVVHDIATAAALPPVCECFDVTAAADTGTSCTESTQAPLAIGPPLFVVHCALLS